MRPDWQKLAAIALTTALTAAIPAKARAEMTESEYRSALKIASEEVQRRKRLAESRANAVSSSVLRELFGRYYEEGDSWVVAAYREESPMMRMTSDPAHLRSAEGQVGVFKYEVVKVRTGLNPEVELRVTEAPGFGAAEKIDPRVTHLTLTMNDQLSQSVKQYTFASTGNDAPSEVRVSAEGIRSSATPMDLFPLDVPDVFTARSDESAVAPKLPDALARVAARAGFAVDSGRTKAFEQEDFFGRAVRILWTQGDPWPAYLKTPQGVAVLLSKQVRGR